MPRFLLVFVFLLAVVGAASASAAVYPRRESRFNLPGLAGNPFDFTQNDVRVTVTGPNGQTARVPAFFDGGDTWRVRFTPHALGKYAITRVTRNGTAVVPAALIPRTFVVAAQAAGPGFVRRDPKNKARFVFDDGSAYYPIGHNAAWKNGGDPDVPELFDKMGAAGENWSRVWMNHWDNKNLDWVPGESIPLGTLDLDAARRWDGIVASAEKNGIHFQMVLQHHGQYTTRTNPNWDDNPWNAKNPGGFLQKPDDFFTDARARALTKAKYRYIVARWGCSPAILAWELFNEVEWTNAITNGRAADVAAWHRQMAEFLRAQDPNRHLVTTSSDRSIAGLYDAMDYVQPHAYPVDAATTVTAATNVPADRPLFWGEIGPQSGLDRDDGAFLHTALWASLMSGSGGAAQYWAWDNVERRSLYGHFAAATGFVRALGGANALTALRPIVPGVETAAQGSVVFGPGAGWGTAKQTEFTLGPSGDVAGIGGLPAFFQGNAHREMLPGATFHVTFREPGTCRVTVRQAAKAGARLVLRVDGTEAASRDFPAAASDTPANVIVEATVPAGAHAVRIENTGADWVVIEKIAFAPYGPTLRALAKAGPNRAAVWVFPAAPGGAATTGRITLPGLASGAYTVTWWDTRTGRALSTQTVSAAPNKPLVLQTPPVTDDIAAFIVRRRRAR